MTAIIIIMVHLLTSKTHFAFCVLLRISGLVCSNKQVSLAFKERNTLAGMMSPSTRHLSIELFLFLGL